MEKEFFDLLGLGVPFYLGAATYAVFAWLDSYASDDVTQVISSWLRGHSHGKPDLGKLIINAFDHLYTSPLFSFRAFRRSAAISTVIWALLILAPFVTALARISNDLFRDYAPPVYLPFVIGLPCICLFITVLSDYISLLFVRRFLNLAITHPIRASIMSSIVGCVVIMISFSIVLVVSVAVAYLLDTYEVVTSPQPNIVEGYKILRPLGGSIYFFTAAFIIHLWLPLFALSLLIVQLVYWLFRAVEGAQWALKEGYAHPFRAIGIVATIIVFGSAMVVKGAWTVL